LNPAKDRQVYAWGSNQYGQLGVIMQESEPTRLGTQQNNKIQSMSHFEVENTQEVSTSCLDTTSTGCKISEQLSQEVFSERFLCLPKVGKLGIRALVVAAGSEHSAAVCGK
jgi:alpha-tubulin suppressor-like RCC1 family protein